MLSDVRNYYGLTKDFGQVGYYETGQSQQIVKELSHEIRAAIFDLEGFGGDKLSYVTWLLSQCLGTKTKAAATDSIKAVLTEDAIALLCTRLSTPLQLETYLSRAFEEGFNVGQKPVTLEVIETILAKDLNDMEPRLTRYGYNAKVLCEVLNVKPREVRALLRGQLPAGRAQELQHEMLAVGIPF